MFENKNINILIIEESAPLRIALKEFLKSVGFTEIQVSKSIREALSIIAVADKVPDWIIASLFPEGEYNAIQLLSILLRYAELRKTKLSLLINEEHKHYLTNAFEMGLFSWHIKNVALEILKQDLINLFKTAQSFGWDPTLTSAHYLRKHLTESGYFEDRLVLEKNLTALYPKNSMLLIYLAEAYFLSKNIGKALMYIDEAKSLDPSIKTFADSMAQKYYNITDVTAQTTKLAHDLELKNVVVIDPDEAVQNTIKDIFKNFGIENILTFSDGQSAWEYLDQTNEPDIIVMEWKIPKLSGPCLIQKIRTKGFCTVAIIIYSALVSTTDKALIREMGGSDVITKPLTQQYLAANIAEIIKQEKKPQTATVLEKKIRQALAAKDYISAKKYFSELQNIPNVPDHVKEIILAEFAYYDGDYIKAKELALHAISKSSDSLILFNLIGKILIKLGQFDLATKFLDKANAISPHNIQRLVDLAEANSEIGNHDTATKILDNAKKIDKDNKLIEKAEVTLAFNAGELHKVQLLIQDEEKSKHLVSYLNNKGVMLSKNENFKESIEFYNKALQCVSSNNKEIYAKVKYNLALALAKDQKLNESVKYLDEILQLLTEDDSLYKKSKSLKQRLETAIQKGAKVNIKSEIKTENEETYLDASVVIPFITKIKPGELCCYQVFSFSKGIDPRFKSLVETLPKFEKFKPNI